MTPRWLRNRRRRVRRWQLQWLRDLERRVEETTHVRACSEWGSTQLCEPDCPVAPWNQD